jgi:pSer/pThr/pTyr-binding forkhead associated (FHA) protein
MPGRKTRQEQLESPWGAEEAETTNPWDEQAPTTRHVAKRMPLERPQRRHSLEQRSGPGAPRSFNLEGAEVVIGRSTECQIRIDSGDVSRKHLKLTRQDDEYGFEDLGSRNGVFLNGVKVHSAVLRDDDQVQMGDVIFVYHEGS